MKTDDTSVKWSSSLESETKQQIIARIFSNWSLENGPVDVVSIADHFDIYRSLFHDGFFVPQNDWEVEFEGARVLYGNIINPSLVSTCYCCNVFYIEFDLLVYEASCIES